MLGGGANNPTLQSERFHGRSVAVLVFVQPCAPHHIVRREPGTGFRLMFLLALPLPAETFSGHNGNDGGVQMGSLLVHVQYARYKVLFAEGVL